MFGSNSGPAYTILMILVGTAPSTQSVNTTTTAVATSVHGSIIPPAAGAAGGVTWSNPVLIEAPNATHPKGPGVPDHFFGFDDKHFFGMGQAATAGWPSVNGSWQFSSDGGLSWVQTPGFTTPDGAAMVPLHQAGGLGSTLSATGAADTDSQPGLLSYRTVGHYHGPTEPTTEGIHGWNLEAPREYSMRPDGSGFIVSAAQGGSGPTHNVTFSGLPAQGVNASFIPLQPGTRNYGIVRAANGHFVLLMDLLWATPPTFHGDPWTQMATVTFTSADGFAWRYGGVVANWTDVRTVPGGAKEYGPSESDLVLLADNTTLLSVVRMDGDSSCFPHGVPPSNWTRANTVYRNYAASYSEDNGVTWSFPKPIEGTGCARPRLRKLSSGPLILTGGRLCVENISGIFMWLNRDGMGGFDSSTRPDAEIWVRHSISAQHNLHWKGDPAYLFSELVNSSAVFESLAYTSIIATGPRSAAITYNKFWPGGVGPNGAVSKGWPGPSANFVIQVAV